ncbi:protein windbeutel [Drosophila grimshawi]|uniref:GH23094 n=1 Tax=Drosophila grimshawi TaxID=7222 RepID=B4JVC5_DROGR|nr:protein windbeutel [Drosophila grimshawi]EDV98393.1 GH23094 [Drosophila grimshawi]
MIKLMLTLPLLLATLLAQSPLSDAISCAGCVDLDEINFDKTIARFPYALIKFDIAFPYGEKHEAFAAFSMAAHKATAELLVATVGIKDYGELENKALGERFKLDEKQLPGIFLFTGSSENYLQFPAHLDVTLDNLKSFVSSNTPLYIGRDGCLKEFNDAIRNYANKPDNEQLAVISEMQLKAAELSLPQEQQNAKVYLVYMRRINEHGYNFVEQETKRLLRLRAGKVTTAKKLELQQKLNILEAFRVHKLTKSPKVEL